MLWLTGVIMNVLLFLFCLSSGPITSQSLEQFALEIIAQKVYIYYKLYCDSRSVVEI